MGIATTLARRSLPDIPNRTHNTVSKLDRHVGECQGRLSCHKRSSWFRFAFLLTVLGSRFPPVNALAPSSRKYSRMPLGRIAVRRWSHRARNHPSHEVHPPSNNGHSIHYVLGHQPKPLVQSIAFYARFIVQRFLEHRRSTRERRRRGLVFKKNKSQDLTAVEEEQMNPWETFKKLNEQRKNVVKLAGYDASIVVPSFAILLLGAFMNSVIPEFYSECVQCVVTLDPSRAKCIRALAGLLITSTLGAFFTGLRGSLFWMAGCRANYNVRAKLHRSLLLQEAAFFDRNDAGHLLSRLNNDVNQIGMVISFHVNIVLRQFAQFVFGSMYLMKISPSLSICAFGGIGIVAWIAAIYGGFARDLAQLVQDKLADATAVAETSFSMSETIRAFDGVNAETDKYERASSRALELEEVQALAYGTHKFGSDTFQGILQVLLLFFCWSLGRAGGLPAAQLTTFIFYTNFVLESSNEVGDRWAKIQSAVGASSSVFDLVRRVPIVRDPVKHVLDTHSPQQHVLPQSQDEPVIQMKNVTVTYGNLRIPALVGVDVDIRQGDRVAIVGRSGSGKSSMLRSMLRFYDPSSGSVRLEGRDLKHMTRQDIAEKVSVVSQEPGLFPMSLVDNVLYGIDKDAADTMTGEACYSEGLRSAADESLSLAGLPMQDKNDLDLHLDTRVGDGGRALSGGQRARVAIARALVRDPEVLLLDEPTAALDSLCEKKVVEDIKLAMEHAKCMVMVTHRLGVIRALGVNRVLVMRKGRIAETGHPEHLLRIPDGLYANLAREQGIKPLEEEPMIRTGINDRIDRV